MASTKAQQAAEDRLYGRQFAETGRGKAMSVPAAVSTPHVRQTGSKQERAEAMLAEARQRKGALHELYKPATDGGLFVNLQRPIDLSGLSLPPGFVAGGGTKIAGLRNTQGIQPQFQGATITKGMDGAVLPGANLTNAKAGGTGARNSVLDNAKVDGFQAVGFGSDNSSLRGMRGKNANIQGRMSYTVGDFATLVDSTIALDGMSNSMQRARLTNSTVAAPGALVSGTTANRSRLNITGSDAAELAASGSTVDARGADLRRADVRSSTIKIDAKTALAGTVVSPGTLQGPKAIRLAIKQDARFVSRHGGKDLAPKHHGGQSDAIRPDPELSSLLAAVGQTKRYARPASDQAPSPIVRRRYKPEELALR